ncbi:hypothetical protein DXG01_009259 [Tephrocybe rancida]|nr:hypothetical protein DXG01_009259 [Tephrocybe rancida]
MPAWKKQPTPESDNDSLEDFVVPHAIDLSGANDDEVEEVVEVKQKKASPIKKKAVAKAKAIAKSHKSTKLLELTSSEEEPSKLEKDDRRAKADKRQIVPGLPNGDQSPSQEIKPVKKKPCCVPVRAVTPVEDSVSEDSDNLPVSPSKPPMEKGKGKATAPAPRYVLSYVEHITTSLNLKRCSFRTSQQLGKRGSAAKPDTDQEDAADSDESSKMASKTIGFSSSKPDASNLAEPVTLNSLLILTVT